MLIARRSPDFFAEVLIDLFVKLAARSCAITASTLGLDLILNDKTPVGPSSRHPPGRG
jgi:hypothetical protein